MLRSTYSRAVGALLVVLGAIALGACSTPTLPLPPPAALSSTEPDAEGFVTVEGDVLEEAYVFVLNEDLGRGVIVRADASGHFVARVEARIDDTLTIWQRKLNDIGEQRTILVPYP